MLSSSSSCGLIYNFILGTHYNFFLLLFNYVLANIAYLLIISCVVLSVASCVQVNFIKKSHFINVCISWVVYTIMYKSMKYVCWSRFESFFFIHFAKYVHVMYSNRVCSGRAQSKENGIRAFVCVINKCYMLAYKWALY